MIRIESSSIAKHLCTVFPASKQYVGKGHCKKYYSRMRRKWTSAWPTPQSYVPWHHPKHDSVYAKQCACTKHLSSAKKHVRAHLLCVGFCSLLFTPLREMFAVLGDILHCFTSPRCTWNIGETEIYWVSWYQGKEEHLTAIVHRCFRTGLDRK